MQQILNKYCYQPNGLLLLSMPTGSGKTYTVLDFIYAHYQDFAAKKRKILFITNLKKNLPLEDLKQRFATDGKEDEFKSHVLFINSNSETLREGLLAVEADIPDQFKTADYATLKSYVETLVQAKNLPKTVKASLEADIRKRLEPAFRRSITEHLRREFKSKKERLQAIKHNPAYQWIGKLYPAVFTDERAVLFLSIDKFVVKNATLVEPSYYIHERLIDRALIFIDEFDAAKETILKHIIESGVQHRVNLLDLFLNIHNHLMQNEYPEMLLQESVWREEMRARKGWPELRQIIASFQQNVTQIFQTYNLQHVCKSHADFASNQRNFLFYDYQFHHVLDAHRKRIEIIADAPNRINWIAAVSPNSPKTGLNIRSLLREIAGFLTYFQRGISYLADNYRHLKDEDEHIKEAFPLESAVRTVLNHFRLDSADVEFLTNNIMERNLPYGSRSGKGSVQRQNFYDMGFRYHDIVDNDEHDTLSKIYMFNFNRTPESFLAGVCAQAMVVGISATAGLPTNIGNYDLDYLKFTLGDAFIHLEESEITRLKQAYAATRGYDQIEIKANFVAAASQAEGLTLLENILQDREAAQALWNELQHTLTDSDAQSVEFYFCRYVRALAAWKYFLDCADCHAFLCLFTPLPKENNLPFDLGLLRKYAALLAADRADILDDDVAETMAVLSGENFEEKKQRLRSDLENGRRRFIISSYQTIGSGQNLQFPIPAAIEPVHINHFPKRLEMDINGLYLDRPTNLLVNIHRDPVELKAFIKYIFQLEFLVENGAMAAQTFRSKLDEAFHRYVGRMRPKRTAGDFFSLYQTDAYTRFLNKVVIQAIGRICRTNMKAATIHLLADAHIKKRLTQFSPPKALIPVHEYTALVRAAGVSAAQPDDVIEAQNRAALRSNRATAYIFSQLNTPWAEESIEAWQALRAQTLRQPAIAKASDCDPAWSNIYLQLPEAGYAYRYTQENDYRDIEIFFSAEQGDQEASERSARLAELMQIDLLRNLFTQSGWATEFSKSELMLTPPMFNNIYKGALGEVCGQHILHSLLNLRLMELAADEFELFDYKTEQNIYVDFKLWQDRAARPAGEIIEQIREKIAKVDARRVFIINILDSSDTAFTPVVSSDRKIVEIPYLCQQGKIDDDALTFILQEFQK